MFPNATLKAKGDFLFHYSAMVKFFGPLIKTLRFEAKNGFCKSLIASSKNFRNICKTIATRHQLFMYLCYKEPEYLESWAVKHINSSEKPASLFSWEEQHLIHEIAPEGIKTLCKSKGVLFQGQRYHSGSGSAVIIKCVDEDYLFGRIECIIYITDTPFIICTHMTVSYFDSYFHAYNVKESTEISIVNISELPDHHPFGIYSINKQLYIPLKYFVPNTLS